MQQRLANSAAAAASAHSRSSFDPVEREQVRAFEAAAAASDLASTASAASAAAAAFGQTEVPLLVEKHFAAAFVAWAEKQMASVMAWVRPLLPTLLKLSLIHI